jgi:hypothetical protein
VDGMSLKQLTVFMENQSARLMKVAEILKERDINLLGFSTTEAKDYGVLRLVVSDVQAAGKALKDEGFIIHLVDVICAEIEDRPGELYKILNLMAREGISIDYIYVIAGTRIVMNVADINGAEEVLRKSNIKLCS